MNLQDLTRTPARRWDRSSNTAWAEGLEVALPRHWLAGEKVAIDPGMVADLRDLRAYTMERPWSSRLPFSYQLIPPVLRRKIASVIGRGRLGQEDRWARFPAWPLDLSVDFWNDHLGVPTAKFSPTPVVLTHDLDSLEGLRNFTKMFSPLESNARARSVNFIVPKGWEIPMDLLDELTSRGHGLGIHGFDHSNKTPFLAARRQGERLAAARGLISRYGIKGYRAPSLLRTPSLVAGLEGLYAYDSSFPTSGGLFPVPNNGVATARPYRIAPRLWEFPLSMPRDGSLLFLGHTPRQILEIWRRCAELISRSGGVVVLLTHCEAGFSGRREMLSIYAEFLEMLGCDPRYSFSTFSELMDRMEDGGPRVR